MRCAAQKIKECWLLPIVGSRGTHPHVRALHGSLVLLFVYLCTSCAISTAQADPPAQDLEFYERKIRPLLSEHCYKCHGQGSKRLEGGLALDSRAGILKGGDNGPIIASSKPEASLLLEVVRYDGDIQMPPDGKLNSTEIELLSDWVRRRAPLPDDHSAVLAKQAIDVSARKSFWSFQPPRRMPAPKLQSGIQPPNAIDAFWQAALENRSLVPTKQADPRTLIRRATFDLLGLPPSAEEVDQFASDRAPDAYPRLIDRLLDSPHYGERWGRYWLDLMRYADENKTSLEVRGRAWLYRDWVVRALNSDLSYNEFVRKQLAADQMPGTPPADLAALGFLGLSPEYFKELKLAPNLIQSIVADEWEERVDTLGRTFLGLSLACARCHDHKFDPITTDDYYALAGVVASTRLTERMVLPERETAVVRKALQEIKPLAEQIKQLKAAKPAKSENQAKIAALEQQIKAVELATPHYHSALAHVVDDAAIYVLPDGPNHTKLVYRPGEPIDLAIHVRGNPTKLGRVVPRRFLTVLSPGTPQPFQRGSGRLELAEAIVGQAAPLSARVIVNRVWAYHFGRGLVETVSDFGTQGERPSHPELLDDLTYRFIEHGWSLKWLHREIMTTAAYQQASTFDAAKFAVDPDNRLLWRMNRRRLDVEAWRDAILASCGNLDRQIGGPPLALTSTNNHRRTLYAKIDRSDPDDLLRLFDFPEPSAHAPSRVPTTTPLQQLFVLNSPFMVHQADTLAQRLTAEPEAEADAIVRRAYRQLFSRDPNARELQLGVEFLSAGKSESTSTLAAVRQYAHALLGSNEFMFVD